MDTGRDVNDFAVLPQQHPHSWMPVVTQANAIHAMDVLDLNSSLLELSLPPNILY